MTTTIPNHGATSLGIKHGRVAKFSSSRPRVINTALIHIPLSLASSALPTPFSPTDRRRDQPNAFSRGLADVALRVLTRILAPPPARPLTPPPDSEEDASSSPPLPPDLVTLVHTLTRHLLPFAVVDDYDNDDDGQRAGGPPPTPHVLLHALLLVRRLVASPLLPPTLRASATRMLVGAVMLSECMLMDMPREAWAWKEMVMDRELGEEVRACVEEMAAVKREVGEALGWRCHVGWWEYKGWLGSVRAMVK
ncbi:hypothetical protein HK101_012025 [Irineochytrium annulatum]|nr:hypothetical protein HK101_012025 [Irineochytrium annulatum]